MITPTITTANVTEDQIRADTLRWAADQIDPGPRRAADSPEDKAVRAAYRDAAARLRFMAYQAERGSIDATVLHGDTLTGKAHTMTDTTPAGTFTALHAQAVAISDYPRVTLPSGLSGRVSTVPTTDGRYLIGLFGFGVGDIDITLTVDADADVTATVDAALRSRPGFVAALRARQDQDREHGELASPLSEGRDRWLTTV